MTDEKETWIVVCNYTAAIEVRDATRNEAQEQLNKLAAVIESQYRQVGITPKRGDYRIVRKPRKEEVEENGSVQTA